MTLQLPQELQLDLDLRLGVRLLSGKFCCKSRGGSGLCVGLALLSLHLLTRACLVGREANVAWTCWSLALWTTSGEKETDGLQIAPQVCFLRCLLSLPRVLPTAGELAPPVLMLTPGTLVLPAESQAPHRTPRTWPRCQTL